MVKILHLYAAGFILAAFIAVPEVKAHGYLAIPKSRNYLHNSNYCPHCLNAGGVGLTKGTGVYPQSGPHGICGDPAPNAIKEHEAGGKFATGEITGVYEEGGFIHLAAAMSTYHKGLIEYRICRFRSSGNPAEEKAALTEACLEAHVLKQADVTGAQEPNGRFYFLGNHSDNGYYPPKLFHHTFQLPSGLVCDGASEKCVLQMHWITGNTCNDPRIPTEYRLKYLNTCGVYGSWPEEFFNCADIKIVAKGIGGITKPDPSWPAFTPALSEGSTGGDSPDSYYGNSPSPDYYSPTTYSPQAEYIKPPPKALRPPKPPKSPKMKPPPKAPKPPKPPKSPKSPKWWKQPPPSPTIRKLLG
jgi:hypothetical protein